MRRVAKPAAVGCAWLVLGLALALAVGCSRSPANTTTTTTAVAPPEAAAASNTAAATPSEAAPATPAAPETPVEAAPQPASAGQSPEDCKPWEDWDPSASRCAQSPHAHVHALGYAPGAGETCWKYVGCLCREGESPSAGSCAPCSQESVQVICKPD